MRNFGILSIALNYIEDNLLEPFTLEDVAYACSVSLSGLYKLFRYAFHCSLKDYIAKRRLNRAGYDIANTAESITDIAFKYQYNSPEVFCRAFARFWGETPSSFRKRRRYSQLYPRFIFDEGGEDMKKVDLSDLYTELVARKGSYVLCADIVGLKFINDNYGYTAGDIAIATTIKRIADALDEDMFVFRVGRDEFAAMTGLCDLTAVEELKEKILAQNGDVVEADGKEIPLSMRMGIMQIPSGGLCYDELFKQIRDISREEAVNY